MENALTEHETPHRVNRYISEADWDKIYEAIKTHEFSFFPNSLNPNSYKNLMPWESLNKIITEHRLCSPRMRLFKNGESIPENDYSVSKISPGNTVFIDILVERLYYYLREGASLIIDAIEELYQPLKDFTIGLENLLNLPIKVNAYLSWKDVRGFEKHWDGHDVLILQIHGKKKWFIYGKTQKYPVYMNPHCEINVPEKHIWDKTLEEGDLLYIPRGMWHHAEAINEPSLHLTFGIKRNIATDYINWLQEQLFKKEEFRKDIPFSDEIIKLDEYQRDIKKSIIHALEEYTLESFLIYKRSKIHRKSINLPFAAQSLIFKKPLNEYAIKTTCYNSSNLDIKNGNGILKFNGKVLHFSKSCYNFFSVLSNNEVHSLEKLLNILPKKTNQENKLLFITSLVHKGIIEVLKYNN